MTQTINLYKRDDNDRRYGAGASKVAAGNRIDHAENAQKKRAALASRNAYRVAIGLPPVT